MSAASLGAGPAAGAADSTAGIKSTASPHAGWLLGPLDAVLAERHPLALLLLIPAIIILLRLLIRALAAINRILRRGGRGALSPGMFAPRRVQGCAHAYGVVELKGRRPYMEDRHVVVPKVGGRDSSTLYAVFDGHGGDAAAQFCADYIGPILASSPVDPVLDPDGALSHAFRSLDRRFLELAHARRMDDGTTALAALANGGRVIVANAGDSRAVLVQASGRVTALSRDHKPDRNDERERIAKLGGSVVHWGVWRVEGILAVSRAIGDRQLKDYVIPDPETSRTVCGPDDRWLVLATDGLWDVVDNAAVGRLLRDCTDAQDGAEALTQEAFMQGSMDNVTVLVVDLREAARKAAAAAGSPSDTKAAAAADAAAAAAAAPEAEENGGAGGVRARRSAEDSDAQDDDADASESGDDLVDGSSGSLSRKLLRKGKRD